MAPSSSFSCCQRNTPEKISPGLLVVYCTRVAKIETGRNTEEGIQVGDGDQSPILVPDGKAGICHLDQAIWPSGELSVGWLRRLIRPEARDLLLEAHARKNR